MSNVTEGTLTARARFVKKGRTLKIVRTEVRSADGVLLMELTSSHISSR
jgi:acyl-coenzyme A thioesterase PaaI-like protein